MRRAKDRYNAAKPALKAALYKHIGQYCCLDCGTKHRLHFDHRDPELKSFGINWAMQHSYSLRALKLEAEKCDLRCSACHARRHGGNRSSARSKGGQYLPVGRSNG
jgi:hypothetical protein